MSRTKTVQVRVDVAELRIWRRLAKLNKLSLSAWIRCKCEGYVGDGLGALFRQPDESFDAYVKRLGTGKYVVKLGNR